MTEEVLGKQLLSIIIPFYNEEENVILLYQKLREILAKLSYNYEIIFIDDGSTDNSIEKLENILKKDTNLKIIEFSRNFGKEIAITAGIQSAKGDVCIMLDADFQHPLELIPEFIKKWENGAEIVIGVRKKNQGEGLIKKAGSWFFYKIINHIAETKIIPYSTDYRLLDRMVINELNRFTERNRITRGLVDWLGFKREYIYFTADKRRNGKPSYSLAKLVRLALTSFVSLSLFPLKLAGYLGIIIMLFAGFLGLFVIVEQYILNDPLNISISGTAILAIMILFLVGIILACLGLIALYIAQIRVEVLNRPLYVIKAKRGFK